MEGWERVASDVQSASSLAVIVCWAEKAGKDAGDAGGLD